jgi:hypothetical protein
MTPKSEHPVTRRNILGFQVFPVLRLQPLTEASGQELYPAYKIALGAETRCAFAVKTNLLLLGIDAIANAGGELFLPAIARNWKFPRARRAARIQVVDTEKAARRRSFFGSPHPRGMV